MRRFSFVYFFSFIFYCFWSHALDKMAIDYIDTFAQQYNRPFTVVEFQGGDRVELLCLLNHYQDRMTFVLYHMDSVTPRYNLWSLYGNLVVLCPPTTSLSMLKTFSQCEQPDLIVVHNIPDHYKKMFGEYLEQFLQIGDYCAIDFSSTDHDLMQKYTSDVRHIKTVPHQTDSGAFLMFETQKKGLTQARWTSKIKRKNPERVRYRVRSDFKHKTMVKDIDFHPIESQWQRGINLITFVMLYGIYPTDTTILRQVKLLKSIKHNDLVMGNLLIQGRRLMPIDFNDKRRNIRTDACINALLKVFELHDMRKQSPELFMSTYKKFVKIDRGYRAR